MRTANCRTGRRWGLPTVVVEMAAAPGRILDNPAAPGRILDNPAAAEKIRVGAGRPAANRIAVGASAPARRLGSRTAGAPARRFASRGHSRPPANDSTLRRAASAVSTRLFRGRGRMLARPRNAHGCAVRHGDDALPSEGLTVSGGDTGNCLRNRISRIWALRCSSVSPPARQAQRDGHLGIGSIAVRG